MIPTKSSKTKQLTPITFLFLFIFVWFQLPGIIVIISGRSSCSYNSPFSGRKTYSFRACASFEIGQIFPISQVCQRVVNPVVRAVTTSCSLSWSQFSFIFLCVLCVLYGEIICVNLCNLWWNFPIFPLWKARPRLSLWVETSVYSFLHLFSLHYFMTVQFRL